MKRGDSGLWDPEEGLQRVMDDSGIELELIWSEDHVLQLDMDGVEIDDVVLEDLKKHQIITGRRLETTSRSGYKHVYLQLVDPLPQAQRFALQCALGSDRRRTGLDIIRQIHGVNRPSALYETPEEAERVKTWLNELERSRAEELELF